MMFAEIVNAIAQSLNLTADTAIERVGRSVNERYREVVSSCGLVTSTRATVIGFTEIASRYVTFETGGVQKILSVFDAALSPPTGVLDEITFDEMRNRVGGTWPPRAYAIDRMHASDVRIFLDAAATADDLELSADVVQNTTTLIDDDEPMFAADFHDILIYGGKALELDKMEKYDKSAKQEQKFEKRLGELRLFIAASAYKQIHQGKTGGRQIAGIRLVS